MKILLVVPEIRLDSKPNHFPFWASILAAIVEQKGGHVGILDLNALRVNYDNIQVPFNLSFLSIILSLEIFSIGCFKI